MMIDIWQPRWHDRTVLIAKHKVGENNVIRFLKAKSLPGIYTISGETIKKYPIGSNGKIDCYEVPLRELELKEDE